MLVMQVLKINGKELLIRYALVATSFVLTGNGGELRTDDPVSTDNPQTKRTVSSCKRKCILWGRICWTTCDYKYYPDGYYQSTSDYYDDILILNTPHYEIIFDGVNGSNSWMFSKTWFGALKLQT
jgi:hypothetical protein